MASHHTFRRAPLLRRLPVLVASAAIAAMPLATIAMVAAPATPARAADPNYPTIDYTLVLYDLLASAGMIDLTRPPSETESAYPDPASVTATAGSTPLQGASILTSDLGPELASVTLLSLGLDALPIQLPLSSIPLTRTAAPRTWQDVLAGTSIAGVPLQNVTWSQVVHMGASRPAIVEDLTLAEVDWSGSALRDLPLAAFVFGGSDVTSIDIPLQPGEPATDDTNAERWCYLLNSAQPGSCANPASLSGMSLIDIGIQGAPLKNIPLKNIPLKNIDLSTSPLKNIPLKNIVLEVSPLKNIPLKNIDVAASPLKNIPLKNIDWATSPLKNIPLKNIAWATSPLKNIPLKNIDLATSPLKNIPLKNIDFLVAPLKNIPLKNIDLAASGLGGIPLKNIDFGVAPLKNIPLKNINLAATPLKNIPLKNIVLADAPLKNIPLKNINFEVAPLGNIPLKNIDLTSSGLGALPLAVIDWGTAPLGTRPAGDFVTSGAPFASVPADATTLAAVFGASGFTADATLAELAAALKSSSSDIALGDLRLDLAGPAAPDIAIGALVLALQAAGADPVPTPTVGGLDAGTMTVEVLLGDLRLDLIADAPAMTLTELLASLAIDTPDVLLGDLRLDLAKDAPLLTLAEFVAALASTNPDVLVGDLRLDAATGVDALVLDALTGFMLSDDLAGYFLAALGTYTDNTGHDITLGELGTWTADPGGDITLGELAQYLDDTVSLADVLLGLVPPSEFPFENFPIASLDLDAYGRIGISPVPEGVFGPKFPATLTPIYPSSRSITLLNNADTPTDPVNLEVVLPQGATLFSLSGPDGPGDQHLSTDPDGRVRVVVTDVRVEAAASTWHVFWMFGLRLEPTNLDIELRVGDTLIDSAGELFSSLRDGAEPNTPQESLNHSSQPGIRIPDLPVNPAGCSGSAGDCDGRDPVYVDTLAPGFITFAGDVDWYRVTDVRAGSRITADLTNLPLDADLVLYGPSSIGTSPTMFDPSAQGLPGQLVDDPGLGVGQAASALAAGALNDLQLDPGWMDTTIVPAVPHEPMTPLSISQHAGTDPESVGAIAPVTGDYVVAVSGYNGATSIDAYLLRTRVFTPTSEETCSARTFPNATPASGSIPTIDNGVNTLFLTNPGRLAATYGETAANGIATGLNGLMAYLQTHPSLGVNAAVVPLDAYPNVSAAYDAWDDNPCSVSAANGVASQITGILADIRAAAPDVEYITVIGGDDIVPMGRIPDLTRISNESEYASTFDALNPLSAAAKAGYTLTDDMYGDPSPTPVGDGSNLFVPRMAVGRLVETPADIVGQLDSFMNNGGSLDTSTALVAGYDFLADGASAVASRLNTGGRTVDSTLVDAPGTSTPWTTADLISKLFPASGATPQIDSINAHYDHTALLSSAGNAGGDFDIETAEGIAALSQNDELARRILFTVGCHAGLAVPDAYVSGGDAAATTLKGDWAQTLSHAGVAVYVANTGFGIGDTSSVAYSERLMGLYAKLLDGSLTAGQALAYAKQAYYGSLGAVGVYDLKILQQTAFYGLPFWRVSTAPGVTPPAPVAPDLPGTIGTDRISGLAAMPLIVEPTFNQVTTARGRYWTVGGDDPQVTQYRPIQPRTDLSVVTAGKTARGALITSLTSHDEASVNPVLSTPTVDLSSSSPEVRADGVAWPARLATITSSQAPYGRAQSLVLVPGQFLGSSDGTGTQRLFDAMGVKVYYAPDGSTDFAAPVISLATGEPRQSSIAFKVRTTDLAGEVKRVVVGYHDFDGSWKFMDLAQSGTDPSAWAGDGAVTHTFSASEAVEFFVQALDSAGNVAVSNGKATGLLARVPDVTAPTISAAITPAPNAAGWVKGASATVTFTCADVGYGLDFGACPKPHTVFADGTTLVRGSVVDRAGNRSEVFVTVNLDGTAPVVEFTGTAPNYTCLTSDEPSGVATGAKPSLDTQRIDGIPYSGVTCAGATDVAGNAAAPIFKGVSVAPMTFVGFLPPVDNSPTVNVGKAGRTYPVKFQLRDADGAFITVLPAVTSITYDPVSCEPTANLTTSTLPTTTASSSGLSYDTPSNQYIYTWKTPNTKGSCYVLRVGLIDGHTYQADFKLK